MKLLLLKILFISRSKEKGYVIPVVFALGLIMTLIGMISIFQSSDEQVISISKRESSKALAAAEAGVARYREQINRYKVIAMYDACNSWAGDGTCSDSGGNSWAATIPNIDTYCPPSGETNAGNGGRVAALATRSWRNIGTDASQGQYRLIDYTYSSGTLDADNDYDVQPTGTLTVEGRVNQDNINLANEPGASVARIEVILPIQPGLPNPDNVVSLAPELNNFDPALWLVGASDATNIDLGDIQVNGNIVVTDGDCSHSGTLPVADDFADSAENGVVVDPRAVSIVADPDLSTPTSLPTGVVTTDSNGIATTEMHKIREITLADLTTESLPLNRLNSANDESSIVDGDTVYYYKLVDTVDSDPTALGSGTDLVLSEGDTINIRNDRKVVLFVEGDINITAGTNDINVNFDPSNPLTGNDSSHLEIYVTAASNITFDGTGNVNIQALLHAPDSPVTVSGDPTVNFTGAMWVEAFTGKDLTNEFTINSDDRYFNYTYVYDFVRNSNLKIAAPIISAPAEWKTLQAN